MSKNGVVEMGSRKPGKFVNARWAVQWARNNGLGLSRAGGVRRIVLPTGELVAPDSLSRAQIDHVNSYIAGRKATRLPATPDSTVCEPVRTREIDGENLTPAEQRRFRARLQAATDRVNAALREVKAQVYVLNTETLSAAPMSEILALQREVNNLVNAASSVA